MSAVQALFEAGGWVMWPLGATGLLLWTLLVLRALTLRLPAPPDARLRIWIDERRVALDAYTRIIGALITIAPLLGLLGTVGGMIDTFDALTAQGNQRHGVSAGIAAALTTTQMGLAVAIPGLIAARLLDLRASRLLNRLDALGVSA